MIVQIDGTNKRNKGAELMFYAIAQELEHRLPQATIRYVGDSIPKNYFKIKQPVLIPWQRTQWGEKLHIRGLSNRLHSLFSFFNFYIVKRNTRVLFDASGYAFGDKWQWSEDRLEMFTDYLRRHHENGTKIVFLPQALGPFKNEGSKKMLSAINQYADLLIARETISYEYALNAGFNPKKLLLYPDFTITVEGNQPQKYKGESGYITIIPNNMMMVKGVVTLDGYLQFLRAVIKKAGESGRKIFLLNHEGKKDQKLCYQLGKELGVEVVDGLNALETKGFISHSHLVISSRFHGVASALDTAVPCLATSWSHKYEMLFNDYQQVGCVLDVHDTEGSMKKVEYMLDATYHSEVKMVLNKCIDINHKKTEEMWDIIWKTISIPLEK